MNFDLRSRQARALLLGLVAGVPLLFGQGCPSLPIGGGGSPVVVVKSPSLDQTVPVGNLITIVYDATGSGLSVSAFYDRDGVPDTGDEVTFWEDLATGLNQWVQLDTSGLTSGDLYVGISATNASGTTTEYASGRITLASSTTVTVLAPSSDVTVSAGTVVPIQFNAGEDVTDFNYTVFYDGDGVFNGDEITIETGSSVGTPTIEVGFDTTGLSPNVYYVGVTVKSLVGGTSTAYAAGNVIITTGAFVQILSPLGGTVLPVGTLVEVTFAANDPSSPGAMVRLFYDTDGVPDTGDDVTIANVSASGGGAIWNTGAVPPGSYFVAAQLLSTSPPLFSYTDAPILIVGPGSGIGDGDGDGGLPGGVPLITMTAPASDVTVFEGELVPARWTTQLLVGQATIELFREPDFDDDGEPDGAPTRIFWGPEGRDAATTPLTEDWDTRGGVGKWFIGARVRPIDGMEQIVYAEGTVTVMSFRFWVGNFGTKFDEENEVIPQTGPIQGAVFRGYNFGDNAGSAMLLADDYDGDGVRDVVIVAQFGKPFLFSQGGRGAGEAYFIYGSSSRFSGDYDLNNVGQPTLPGVIMTGIIPNPNEPTDLIGRAGSSIPYTPDVVNPQPVEAFATEGLRSVTLIPDQDNDGKMEIAFGVPWCNSYSLKYQIPFIDLTVLSDGRLENNGQFLRGGIVIVSSRNELMTDRNEISRHLDRVLQLHEVGQIFESGDTGVPDYWAPTDECSNQDYLGPLFGPAWEGYETLNYPADGFWQQTIGGTWIDPPRLADPFPAFGARIGCIWWLASLSQIDPPPEWLETGIRPWGGRVGPVGEDDDGNAVCFPEFALAGEMYYLGTGFYRETNSCDSPLGTPQQPYGCRVLGQTTTQVAANPPTTANLFGMSIGVSGDFMLIGAPQRTVEREDVRTLPTVRRELCGEVYMWQLKRPGAPTNEFPYSVPGVTANDELPAPHNHIMADVGYTRAFLCPICNCCVAQTTDTANGFRHELRRPFHIVGAGEGDRVGTSVVGLGDINNDNVDDIALGGEGTNGGKGAVYVIYRRQPEIEADYLLERLQIGTDDVNRLNGLMIIGREGENLGTALAGGADFNDDGEDDLIVGSPRATPGTGFRAGEVFILFGGRNLLSPAQGVTIPELRDSGDGMVIAGEFAGDQAGTTVSNAGDVNNDGIADIMIAAPYASPRYDSDGNGIPDSVGLDLNGDRTADDLDKDGAPDDMTQAGMVYVVFGGEHLTGTIGLDQIGTSRLPGFVLVGRKAGDQVGGGVVQNGLLSRGIHTAGDIDDDGYEDVFVSSVQADPQGLTDAGEVYLMYGFQAPTLPVR
jgi:hypothetical protein